MAFVHKEPYITPEMIDKWNGQSVIIDFTTANDLNTTHNVPDVPTGWTQDNTMVELIYVNVSSYYLKYTDQYHADFVLFWQSNILKYQSNADFVKGQDVRIRLTRYA